MDFFSSADQCCIDHLDRSLFRKSRFQKFFEKFYHKCAFPTGSLPTSHAIWQCNSPFTTRKIHHRKTVPWNITAAFSDSCYSGHCVIGWSFSEDHCCIIRSDQLRPFFSRNQSSSCQITQNPCQPFYRNLFRFPGAHRQMQFIFSLSIHKKMHGKYTYSFSF